jgi:hypothetical protein
MPLPEESAFIVAEREALPGGFRGPVTTAQSRGNIRGRGAGKGKGKKRKASGQDGESSTRSNIRGRGRGSNRGNGRGSSRPDANGSATFVLPDLNEQADEIQVTQNAPL